MFSETLQCVDSSEVLQSNVPCSVLSNLSLFLKYKIVDCFTNKSVLYAGLLICSCKESRNFCIDLPLAEIKIPDKDRKIVPNVNGGNLSPL